MSKVNLAFTLKRVSATFDGVHKMLSFLNANIESFKLPFCGQFVSQYWVDNVVCLKVESFIWITL